MGGFAWVTLATNDSYSLGALVLAHSLKEVGTSQKLAVLITPGVTSSMREKLASVFDIVQEVNILDSKDEANLRLLKRPELGVTFTKLHCWRLTQFDKCVFLDADTLVLENCDELFLREELSAAPDVGWPDCFNSGVFVYQPSNDTYEKLVQFALDKGSFDGGDQGLLNLYFSDWSYKDISKHLPFIYNMSSAATYSYLPAFKQFGGNAKIIHFIGSTKPWLQYFNTETKQVQPSDDLKHIQSLLQHWWNIFCTFIHPTLSPDMTGIAGAFAQLTLGTARTAEQIALDDHLRRQGWEVGNIDYLGRDSFDNIWSKICQTLSVSPASPPPPPPAQQQSSPVIPPPQPPTPKLKESTPPQSEVLSVVKSPAEVINSQVKETTKETVVEAPKPDPIAIETTKPQTPTESQPKQTTIDTPPAAITSEAPQPPKSSEKPAEITPKQSDKPPAATSTITEDLPKTVSAEISKTLAQTAAIQTTKSSVPSESSTKQTTDKSAPVETLTKPPTEAPKIPVEVPVETTPKASSEIPKPPTETPKIPARAAKTSAETSKPIAKPPTEIPAPPGEAPKVPSQSVKTSKPAPVRAPPAETAAVCKKPSVEIPKTTIAKESPDSPKTPQSPKPQTPTKSAPGGGLEGSKSSESKKSKAPKTPDAVDSTVEQLSVDTTVLDTPPPPGDEASGTPTAPKRTVKKTKPKQK